MWQLLLVLWSKCVLVELQLSSVNTILALSNGTTDTVPTNATVLTTVAINTDAISCSANGSSCTTEAKSSTTVATTSVGTTTAPHSVSTTSKPPPAASPRDNSEVFQRFNSEMCTCDLQKYFCDINCCCDGDCSTEDKMVFKTCLGEPNLHRDTSFCEYMDYVYVNNTPYMWEVNQNGLFCIVKSNLPAQYVLQKEQSITTTEDAALQKQGKHSWSDVVEKQTHPSFSVTEDFVFGAAVWVIRNDLLEQFQLPDSFVTSACLIKRDITFLRNLKTKCSQTNINDNNPYLNAETFFKNVSVIRAPRFFNVSWFGVSLQNCPRNICLPIEAKVCDANYEKCANFSANDSRLHTSCHYSNISNENSCLFVTKGAKYNFYHNGTRGFTKVELFLILQNVTYFNSREGSEFSQDYEVNYFWSNYTLNYSSLLSGNPGYLVGKPVLTANLVTPFNGTNSTSFSKIVRNPVDISTNFLVFPANKKGVCVLNNHTHIPSEFGYNMILKCRIKAVFSFKDRNSTATDLCRDLQKIIFAYWPISYVNVTGTEQLIGKFGNANESVITDWIKILWSKTPGQILNETTGNFTNKNSTLFCNQMVTSIKLDVFHSRVDFKDLLNQEKILGATLHFGNNKTFVSTFGKKQEFLFEADIKEEVMFFDITSAKIQKFVDPPMFKISLPYDFFYPFIKVENAASSRKICLVLRLIAVIFIIDYLCSGPD